MVLLDTGTPGTSREIYSEDANGETGTCNPWLTKAVLKPLSYTAQFAISGKELNLFSWCILSLYIYHFWTVTDFSSEKYSGSPGHRNSWYLQRNLRWGCQWWDSNSQPLDYKASALAFELYSSICHCWEGVEFIQLVYCVIIFTEFLNCDWLLIREVQWFYWT